MNAGYRFVLERPLKLDEIESKTIYLYTVRYKTRYSTEYSHKKLKYALKTSSGNAVEHELTKEDIGNPIHSSLINRYTYLSSDKLYLKRDEKTTLRKVIESSFPLLLDEDNKEKLFHFNKLTRQVIELPLSPEQFQAFDEKFKDKENTSLSEEEITEIENITHHQHKRTLDNSEYSWVKLPITDPRGLILGEITDCCQSIGAEADQCVKDALTLKNNGLYVLLRQKKPGEYTLFLPGGKINYDVFEIVGQSYVVMSSTNNVILDSVEFLKRVPVSVIQQVLAQFAEKTLQNYPHIKRVVVGDISQDSIGGLFGQTPIIEIMKEGFNYGDARRQTCIAERPPLHLTALVQGIQSVSLSEETISEDTFLLESKKDPEAIWIIYLAQYVNDPNFFQHLTTHAYGASLSAWRVQLFLSFHTDPGLEQLEKFYQWLKKEGDTGSEPTDVIFYQNISRVSFDSISLLKWENILNFSTMSEVYTTILVLGALNFTYRNFPTIDFSKLPNEDALPPNYTRAQFLIFLLLLLKDSFSKPIEKTFEELVELTKTFIQENKIDEAERIRALTSDNTIDCCAAEYSNCPIVSFRELVQVQAEPENYCLDSNKVAEEVKKTYVTSSIINALTARESWQAYILRDSHNHPIVTVDKLVKTCFNSNMIADAIKLICHHEVSSAVSEGLLSIENVLENYNTYLYKNTFQIVIECLRSGLFSADQLNKSFLLFINSEVIQAFKDHLFSPNDFTHLAVYLHKPEVISALRDKIFTLEDFKNNPSLFSNADLGIISQLRTGKITLHNVLQNPEQFTKPLTFTSYSFYSDDDTSDDDCIPYSATKNEQQLKNK